MRFGSEAGHLPWAAECANAAELGALLLVALETGLGDALPGNSVADTSTSGCAIGEPEVVLA